MTVAPRPKPSRRPRCAAVALCTSTEDRTAIVLALDGLDVDFRERSREVLNALKATGAPLFITRPSAADEVPYANLLREIRDGAPAFDIVALARSSKMHRDSALAITMLGAGEVLFIDDPGFAARLNEIVERTRLSHRVAECGREVAAGLPPRLGALVRWSFQRGMRLGSLSEFAAARGVAIPALRRMMEDFEITVEEFLRWRRVIAATVLFEHTLLTVDRVARRVGFPSGPALHNAISRTAGAPRAEVLRHGGSAYLIRLLREKMGL
jgi:AraC-like DNA-binding protein